MSNLNKYLQLWLMSELAMQQTMLFSLSSSPIFIPRKHTKMKHADHKRMKAKRKNKN